MHMGKLKFEGRMELSNRKTILFLLQIKIGYMNIMTVLSSINPTTTAIHNTKEQLNVDFMLLENTKSSIHTLEM